MENTYPLLNRAREYARDFTERIRLKQKRFYEKDFKDMISLEEKISNDSKRINLDFLDPEAYFSLGESLYSLFRENSLINRDVDEDILNDSIRALLNVKEIVHLENPQKLTITRFIGKDLSLLPQTLFILSQAYLEKAFIEMRKQNMDIGNACLYLSLSEDNRDLVTYYDSFPLKSKEVKYHYKRLDKMKEFLDHKRQQIINHL